MEVVLELFIVLRILLCISNNGLLVHGCGMCMFVADM